MSKARMHSLFTTQIAIIRYNPDNEDHVTVGSSPGLDWSVQRDRDQFWICLAPTRDSSTTRTEWMLFCPASLAAVREQFKIVTTANMDAVCARIIHLSRYTGRQRSKHIVGLGGLRDELQELIVRATMMELGACEN